MYENCSRTVHDLYIQLMTEVIFRTHTKRDQQPSEKVAPTRVVNKRLLFMARKWMQCLCNRRKRLGVKLRDSEEEAKAESDSEEERVRVRECLGDKWTLTCFDIYTPFSLSIEWRQLGAVIDTNYRPLSDIPRRPSLYVFRVIRERMRCI